MPTTNQYHPDKVFPPSVTLNEKLEEMGISAQDLAKSLGESEELISLLLEGKMAISARMAQSIARVTGIPAAFWISKSQRYDEYKIDIKNKRLTL